MCTCEDFCNWHIRDSDYAGFVASNFHINHLLATKNGQAQQPCQVNGCLRGLISNVLYLSVDGQFGYYFVLSKFVWKGEYWQSSIQPRLEWYSSCLCFQNQSITWQNAPGLLHILLEWSSFDYCSWNTRFRVWIKDCMIQKILIEDPEHILHVPWSIFIPLRPLSPGRVQFISKIVKIPHKIWNWYSLYIFYHFTTFLEFELFWPYHIWSSTRGYEPKCLLNRPWVHVPIDSAV